MRDDAGDVRSATVRPRAPAPAADERESPVPRSRASPAALPVVALEPAAANFGPALPGATVPGDGRADAGTAVAAVFGAACRLNRTATAAAGTVVGALIKRAAAGGTLDTGGAAVASRADGGTVGALVAVGGAVGRAVARTVGRGVGGTVRTGVGTGVGAAVAATVGPTVGCAVAATVGTAVGARVGATLGAGVGGCVGLGVAMSGVGAGGTVEITGLGAGLGSAVGRARTGGATTAMRSGCGVPWATSFASSGRRRALLAVRSRSATRGRGVRTIGGTMRGVAVRRATGAGVRRRAAVGAADGTAVAGTEVGAERESARTVSLLWARCSWLTVYVWSVSEPPESDDCTAATTISSATIRCSASESV